MFTLWKYTSLSKQIVPVQTVLDSNDFVDEKFSYRTRELTDEEKQSYDLVVQQFENIDAGYFEHKDEPRKLPTISPEKQAIINKNKKIREKNFSKREKSKRNITN